MRSKSSLAGLIFTMHAGMAAAQDANEDALEQGNLLQATAHAAALSAIPFGIATLGMLVSAPPLSDVLRMPAKIHGMQLVGSKSRVECEACCRTAGRGQDGKGCRRASLAHLGAVAHCCGRPGRHAALHIARALDRLCMLDHCSLWHLVSSWAPDELACCDPVWHQCSLR